MGEIWIFFSMPQTNDDALRHRFAPNGFSVRQKRKITGRVRPKKIAIVLTA